MYTILTKHSYLSLLVIGEQIIHSISKDIGVSAAVFHDGIAQIGIIFGKVIEIDVQCNLLPMGDLGL